MKVHTMIDLHAHILYGIDDGPRHRETTREMLRQAEEDGIGTVVATPHYVVGANLYSPKALSARFDEVSRLIEQEGINIKLLLGNELFLDEYIFEAVESGKCHTLACTSYVLLELPMAGIPLYTEKVLYQFLAAGYRPILAHPERNAEVLDNPAVLIDFVEMGCIAQINSTSINGVHGRRVQDTAKLLLKSNMGHLVASDCHSDKRRSPELSAAYKRLSLWLGSQRADRLFRTNPETVLQDVTVETDRPKLIQRGRGLGDRIKGYIFAAK